MERPTEDLEHQYDYEYDDDETETFFVDIDLSSLNPPIMPNNPAPSQRTIPAKRKIDDSTTQTPDTGEPRPDNAGSHTGEAHTTPTQEPQETPTRIADSNQDTVLTFPSRVQILDLSSVNPLVSYQGQVFSCTWSDMVGTNMFFTQPEMTNDIEPLRSTDDYDLIGMSRIKLIGHRAKLTKKASQASEADSDAATGQPGVSDNALSDSNHEDRAREKQASFLAKLMDIKRRRGETELVRTYVDNHIASADQQKEHETHREAIHALNARVFEADADATARLQEIYSRPDEGSESTESSQRATDPHNEN